MGTYTQKKTKIERDRHPKGTERERETKKDRETVKTEREETQNHRDKHT